MITASRTTCSSKKITTVIFKQVSKAIKRALANATAFEIAAIKERTQSKGSRF